MWPICGPLILVRAAPSAGCRGGLRRRLPVREPRPVTEDAAQDLAREIRVAGFARDAETLARLVTERGIERHLQEAGEAVLAMLEQDRDAAAEPARALVAALGERSWPGDADLAELLAELVDERPSERRRIRAIHALRWAT